MSNLFSRAIGITLKPKTEWAVVDGEAATTQGLLTSYVGPWAVISAIARVLATLVMSAMAGAVLGSMGGMGGMGGMLGMGAAGVGLVGSIVGAVLGVAVTIGVTILMGIIIDALAPSFGAEKNSVQAMKVAAYAPSAMWLASIAAIVPIIGGLIGLAALIWTIFIIHWGLVAVMKPPADKAVGFTAVVIIIWCVIGLIIGAIVGMIVGMMALGALATGASAL